MQKQEILNRYITIVSEETINYQIVFALVFFVFVIGTALLIRQHSLKTFNQTLQDEIERKTSQLSEAYKVAKIGSWTYDLRTWLGESVRYSGILAVLLAISFPFVTNSGYLLHVYISIILSYLGFILALGLRRSVR